MRYLLLLAIPLILPTLSEAGSFSTGYSTGATATDDNAGGSQVWSSTPSCLALDGTSAQSAGTSAFQNSHFIVATGFGFNIPSNATITGVTVDIRKGKSSNLFSIFDTDLKLVIGGVRASDNKADVVDGWAQSLTETIYGGSSDLWGAALTPAVVNASNFGVSFQANFGGAITANIDAMLINVSYTTPDGSNDESRNAPLDLYLRLPWLKHRK